MDNKENILQHLRDYPPNLPQLTEYHPLFGYGVILTSLPTVNKKGEEGEGGSGCTTSAKAATKIGREQRKMRFAEPILQGERMRVLSHKLQERLKIDKTKNHERRLAESIPELQRREGRHEDQRAFREVAEAVLRGENIILEAKFGALLIGWLAEFAPMIPISAIALDCEDAIATQRKRDVTQTKEKRYVRLEETAEDRVRRVGNDNTSIQEMYADEFPGIEFNRAKQLSVVTDVIKTSHALVEEPANVILDVILKRTELLRAQYRNEHPLEYAAITAMQYLGLESVARKVLFARRKLDAKLRNFLTDRGQLSIGR